MRLRLYSAIAALALAACAAQRLNGSLEGGYGELVQLRGAAITLLQDHRISASEAMTVQTELDAARASLNAHQITVAQIQMDAVKQYLKARQGGPL